MVREKFTVRLTPEQRDQLEHMVRAGKSSARVTTRARVLFNTDEGWSAPKVAQDLDVSEGTVFSLKRRFAEDGLEGALEDRVQAHRNRKLDHLEKAHLIALACIPAPGGHDHWTLRLLADRMVESLSHEAVRLHLRKRPRAEAEEAVVHPQNERRPRSSHGGCAGPLCRTLRPTAASGLFRREFHPVAGRRQGTDSGQAWQAQAGGLRIPAGGPSCSASSRRAGATLQ